MLLLRRSVAPSLREARAETYDVVARARLFAVCGNNACEYGEACRTAACTEGCAADCGKWGYMLSCPIPPATSGFPLKMCGGHGTCDARTGTCVCFKGFTGQSCSECDNMYERRTAFNVSDCIRVPPRTCLVRVMDRTSALRSGVYSRRDAHHVPLCGVCLGRRPKPRRAWCGLRRPMLAAVSVTVADRVPRRRWCRIELSVTDAVRVADAAGGHP